MEESWPKAEAILFLGDWCRLYSRKEIWSVLEHEVMPYHWDERAKLYSDFQKLQNLNAFLIPELSRKLNRIHGVKHNPRYWKVLLGYWLNLLTATLLDRWCMIESAVESGKVSESIRLEIPSECIVANDSYQFASFIVTDLWNQYIYGEILDGWTEIPLRTVEFNKCAIEERCELPSNENSSINEYWLHFARKLYHAFGKNDDYFFIKSYLPFYQDAIVQLRLGQLPKYWNLPDLPSQEIKPEIRDWELRVPNDFGTFGEIVGRLIPRQLPKIFLEGYQQSCQIVNSLPLPRQPKSIFTSNSHFFDDVFKLWAGTKVEEGSRLIIAEHGGCRAGLFNGGDSFQCSICNELFSWSSGDKSNPKIKAVGIIKTVGKKQKWDPFGWGLLVEVAMPRYSFDLRAMVIAGQMLDYFEDQYKFYESLSSIIQRKLLVRLYSQDYGWSQQKRWRDRFPLVKINNGRTPIKTLIGNSRIYISTYNATTYLESMSLNMPTIIFWNPNHWELHDEAVSFFKLLEDAGIFHQTPQSAAAKVNEIWDDVMGWWYTDEIQKVREHFCNQFARKIAQPTRHLAKLLRRTHS